MAEPQWEPAKTLDSPPPATDQTHSALQSLSTSSTVPGSGTEPSEAAGTLARNVSFSKLNAEAPAFVPGKPPPAARVQDPRILVVPPPTPPPPPSIAAGMVHVYAGAAAPPPPFHMAVPPPPNHLHPHINHHQQHMQYHNHHQPHGHGRRHHHQQQHPKHHNQFVGGGGGEEREAVPVRSLQDPMDKDNQLDGGLKNELSEDNIQKILNQVEYYFSDVNLATTDHLIRFIKKDPEGYVSMSVVASFKKIKALISSHSQLAAVLRSSTKLVVSEDGKRVKRLNPLTVSDMEELQSRIIVAENLPEDHCYQNLIKIFSAVGSVKSIRTCLPQAQNATNGASRSLKQDNKLYNTKVHAFVEYETVELAEKAVAELNDEGDWRNGLRVRLLHNNPSKSQQARGKRAESEGEEATEEEGASTSEHVQIDQQTDENSGQFDVHSQEQIEEQANDKEGGQKKGRSRNRGRGRGSRGGGQNQLNHNHNHHHQNNNTNNNRGHHHMGSPPTSYPVSNNDQPTVTKQLPPPGPRMPDGTRGFSMGRGKPLTVTTA